MSKFYLWTLPVWRNGLQVEVDKRVRLSDAEAKYLGHAIEPEVKAASEASKAKAAPAAKAAVTEAPANADGAKS